MRIGITGWRGFIGSRLKERIENPILFQGDMRRLTAVSRFVKKCDRIYHVAGLNRDIDGGIIENNLRATGNLVATTKMMEVSPEIIFVSSTQVEWNPKSEYGATKTLEEGMVQLADKWCIFRVPNVYGPGCKPFYNSVVATFAYQIAHGKGVDMKNPNDTREFVHIDDVVDDLMKPELNEYVRVSGDILAIQDVYDLMTTRLGEHEGLEKTLAWYKEHLDDFVSAS